MPVPVNLRLEYHRGRHLLTEHLSGSPYLTAPLPQLPEEETLVSNSCKMTKSTSFLPLNLFFAGLYRLILVNINHD